MGWSERQSIKRSGLSGWRSTTSGFTNKADPYKLRFADRPRNDWCAKTASSLHLFAHSSKNHVPRNRVIDHLHRHNSPGDNQISMKPALRQLCCLILLSLAVLRTESNAKPDKPVSSPPPIDFSELDKLVAEELKERNTPGAVIAIVSGDQVVYQKAFGVANVETNAAMQPEMLFRLGSTTKMFTAAALVTLAENNKIKMNETIGQTNQGIEPQGCE